MPRDGSSNYTIPAGSEGIPDTTIESSRYNSLIHDVEQDLNLPRPIIAGGTGATSAEEALTTLKGERSSQVVTNYDSHLYYPGSFYSASTATNPPVAGHAFAGYIYSSDAPAYPPANLNLTVEARDLNDTIVPGRIYVREKKAGTWGPWKIDGRTIVGLAEGISSATADMFFGLAGTPPDSAFIVNSKADVTGVHLFVVEKDGTVRVTQAPVNDFDAATKKYVDDIAAPLASDKAPIASPTFTGDPKAPTPSAGDSDTSIATTQFVTNAIAAGQPVHASVAEYRSNSAPTKIIDTGTMWGAAAAVAITSGVAPDFNTGIDFYLNGVSGATISNPVNTKIGQKGVLWLVGTTVAAWGSSYKFPNGLKPTSTGGWDLVSYVVWDANNILCSFTGGHS